MRFETTAPFPERGSARTPEEHFLLMEQEVLGHLFEGDEERAASWLLENGGRNGDLLREATERHLRAEGNDLEKASKIAEELRSLGVDLREAA